VNRHLALAIAAIAANMGRPVIELKPRAPPEDMPVPQMYDCDERPSKRRRERDWDQRTKQKPRRKR
jgi:hypothetical protein